MLNSANNRRRVECNTADAFNILAKYLIKTFEIRWSIVDYHPINLLSIRETKKNRFFNEQNVKKYVLWAIASYAVQTAVFVFHQKKRKKIIFFSTNDEKHIQQHSCCKSDIQKKIVQAFCEY